MTSLDLIPVGAGTVIRSNDAAASVTVEPGAPVWKDQTRLFLTPEDFSGASPSRSSQTPTGRKENEDGAFTI